MRSRVLLAAVAAGAVAVLGLAAVAWGPRAEQGTMPEEGAVVVARAAPRRALKARGSGGGSRGGGKGGGSRDRGSGGSKRRGGDRTARRGAASGQGGVGGGGVRVNFEETEDYRAFAPPPPTAEANDPTAWVQKGHCVPRYAQGGGAWEAEGAVPRLTGEVAHEVFLHPHCPKTAGTSTFYMLKEAKNFPQLRLCTGRTFGNDDEHLKEAFQKHFSATSEGKCNAVSYELDVDKGLVHESVLCEAMRRRIRIMTFLRRPTSQVISAIQHDLRRGHYSTPQEKLHNITCLEKPGYRCDNMQVRRVSPSLRSEEAIGMMQRHFFFIGIVEHWKVSMCLLAYQLGPQYNGPVTRESCHCTESVHTKAGAQGFARNVAKNSATFTAEDIKEISARTMEDTALYSWGLVVFQQRVRQMERDWNIMVRC